MICNSLIYRGTIWTAHLELHHYGKMEYLYKMRDRSNHDTEEAVEIPETYAKEKSKLTDYLTRSAPAHLNRWLSLSGQSLN